MQVHHEDDLNGLNTALHTLLDKRRDPFSGRVGCGCLQSPHNNLNPARRACREKTSILPTDSVKDVVQVELGGSRVLKVLTVPTITNCSVFSCGLEYTSDDTGTCNTNDTLLHSRTMTLDRHNLYGPCFD